MDKHVKKLVAIGVICLSIISPGITVISTTIYIFKIKKLSIKEVLNI